VCSSDLRKPMNFIWGLGLGAGLMYLADPEKGRRRRSVARDKARSALRESGEAIDKASRDISNRARGVVSEAKSLLGDENVSDDVLAERIRSKIGRLVSHPSAIEVRAEEGLITLRGPVLADEVNDLIAAVSSVRGVSDIENALQVHETADGVPALQGPRRRPRDRFELMQNNWTPAARLFFGSVGSALTLNALQKRAPVRAAIGIALIARAATNKEVKRLFGIRAGRRAVDIEKTTDINAPIERVYEFWSHYENFPQFMSHLHEVRDLGNGRSQWVAAGPAGVPVEWQAEITRRVPNRVLAWKSTPGAVIENAGMINFQSKPDGGTCVNLRLSYNPPAGMLGHMIASVFGADPKRAMDDDLVRVKSFLETGKTRAPGESTTETTAGEPSRAQA